MKFRPNIVSLLVFCVFLKFSKSVILRKILASSEDKCRTFIFSDNDDFEHTNSERYTPEWVSLNILAAGNYFALVNTDTSGIVKYQKSFFDIEYSESDLLLPSKFNLRFSRSCNVVFVTGMSGEEYDVMTSQFYSKIIRPHKDYFVFIGESITVKHLMRSSYASHLRYVYGLIIKESNSKDYKVCEGEILSKKCNSAVNQRNLRVRASFGLQMLRFSNHPNGSVSEGAGVYFEMLRESSEYLNFTITLQSSNGGGSGVKTNSTWTGTVGHVFNKEADIAVIIAFTASRYTILDPSVSIEWIHRTFFIRKPPKTMNWSAMFPRLTGLIWIAVAVIVVVMTVFLYVTVFTRIVRARANSNHLIGSKLKFILAVWSMIALFLGAGFRSKLTVFLTFLNSPSVPATHAELVGWGYTLYFRYYGGTAYQATLNSKSPVHQHIIKNAHLVNTSFDCILAAGLNEKSACLDYEFHGQYAILTNATIFHDKREFFVKSKDNHFPFFMVWGYRKGSPLTETLDPLLYAYIESGLYDHWFKSYFRKSKRDGVNHLKNQKESLLKRKIEDVLENDLSSTPKSLSTNNLMGVFIIVLGGISLSIVLFAVELTYYRKQHIIQKTNDWIEWIQKILDENRRLLRMKTAKIWPRLLYLTGTGKRSTQRDGKSEIIYVTGQEEIVSSVH